MPDPTTPVQPSSLVARLPRWAWFAGLGAAVVAVGIVYRHDPAASAFFPRCLFNLATGLHCPGCGLQRAVHALVEGRVVDALGHNLLATALLPAVLVAWGAVRAGWWVPPALARVWAPRAAAVLVLAFFLLRNLPWAPVAWLAP